jgi:type IV pilus assembly protein PilO
MPDFSVDKIINLPNQQKIIALFAIIAGLGCLYFFMKHKPLQEELELKRGELTKLQSKYNEQQKVMAQLPKFEKELKDLKIKLDESLKLLPNTREIPSLLTNISTEALNSGLKILLFQPENEVIEDFYAKIPVEMKVSGKYHDLGYFFDKVSKLNRIVNISNIDIDSKLTTKGSSARDFSLQASFNAVTFKFVEKEEPSGKKKTRKKRKK